MRTVILKLTGPGIYLPHTDGKALLGVLPNGTHLGTSKTEALDKTPLARHWPIVWAEDFDKKGTKLLSFPEEFLGSRLVFSFAGASVTPQNLDTKAIDNIAKKGWIQIDPALLTVPAHDDRMAAQVLITQGIVDLLAEQGGPCLTSWSTGGTDWSIDTIPVGLTVTLDNVDRVDVDATSYIGLPPKKVFSGDFTNSSNPNPLVLYVGNLCAETVTEWIHNSDSGMSYDTDFLWTYFLSNNPTVTGLGSGQKLPVPYVKGSTVDVKTKPQAAFELVRGGGGNVGCECRICIDQASTFSY